MNSQTGTGRVVKNISEIANPACQLEQIIEPIQDFIDICRTANELNPESMIDVLSALSDKAASDLMNFTDHYNFTLKT